MRRALILAAVLLIHKSVGFKPESNNDEWQGQFNARICPTISTNDNPMDIYFRFHWVDIRDVDVSRFDINRSDCKDENITRVYSPLSANRYFLECMKRPCGSPIRDLHAVIPKYKPNRFIDRAKICIDKLYKKINDDNVKIHAIDTTPYIIECDWYRNVEDSSSFVEPRHCEIVYRNISETTASEQSSYVFDIFYQTFEGVNEEDDNEEDNEEEEEDNEEEEEEDEEIILEIIKNKKIGFINDSVEFEDLIRYNVPIVIGSKNVVTNDTYLCKNMQDKIPYKDNSDTSLDFIAENLMLSCYNKSIIVSLKRFKHFVTLYANKTNPRGTLTQYIYCDTVDNNRELINVKSCGVYILNQITIIHYHYALQRALWFGGKNLTEISIGIDTIRSCFYDWNSCDQTLLNAVFSHVLRCDIRISQRRLYFIMITKLFPTSCENTRLNYHYRLRTTKFSENVIYNKFYRKPIGNSDNSTTTTTISSIDSDDSTIKNSQINNSDTYKIVCYFTNWAWYRSDKGHYLPENINPNLCTHIVYSFITLDKFDLTVRSIDPWADYDNNLFKRVLKVKSKNKNIKILVALGGWNDSIDDKYSRLVADPSARRRFVNSTVQFIEKIGFDGLDLDWEYPVCWQANCNLNATSDKKNFGLLIEELSEEFQRKNLLLSVAVSANKEIVEKAYDISKLSKYADWIAVMTYDYNKPGRATHVAPFFTDDDFNVQSSINHWIDVGMPAGKIILGVPMYGRSYTINKKMENGIDSPAGAYGNSGRFTQQSGLLSYYEVCDFIINHNWTVVEDEAGPYAYKNNQWVSYDDPSSIERKMKFVRDVKLGGASIWALDFDDFQGQCKNGSYPLLRTIFATLNAAQRRKRSTPDSNETYDEWTFRNQEESRQRSPEEKDSSESDRDSKESQEAEFDKAREERIREEERLQEEHRQDYLQGRIQEDRNQTVIKKLNPCKLDWGNKFGAIVPTRNINYHLHFDKVNASTLNNIKNIDFPNSLSMYEPVNGLNIFTDFSYYAYKTFLKCLNDNNRVHTSDVYYFEPPSLIQLFTECSDLIHFEKEESENNIVERENRIKNIIEGALNYKLQILKNITLGITQWEIFKNFSSNEAWERFQRFHYITFEDIDEDVEIEQIYTQKYHELIHDDNGYLRETIYFDQPRDKRRVKKKNHGIPLKDLMHDRNSTIEERLKFNKINDLIQDWENIRDFFLKVKVKKNLKNLKDARYIIKCNYYINDTDNTAFILPNYCEILPLIFYDEEINSLHCDYGLEDIHFFPKDYTLPIKLVLHETANHNFNVDNYFRESYQLFPVLIDWDLSYYSKGRCDENTTNVFEMKNDMWTLYSLQIIVNLYEDTDIIKNHTVKEIYDYKKYINCKTNNLIDVESCQVCRFNDNVFLDFKNVIKEYLWQNFPSGYSSVEIIRSCFQEWDKCDRKLLNKIFSYVEGCDLEITRSTLNYIMYEQEWPNLCENKNRHKRQTDGISEKVISEKVFECSEEGYFADSKDVKKFYRCVANGDGTFRKYHFQCGTLYWCPSIQNCTF